ncbi:hypothetical protein EIP91_009518 [Steccherinum ochraceum]|uniref:Alpha/beta hydrolase fold-3 domain-containing protein n=1 Tax=Steccherinum ochraceum TaxID=92696 RepID=A0A4R0R9M4_9APHY|nr:hypothetical protein EIP91_009518 [Steccherinum ochraceum]
MHLNSLTREAGIKIGPILLETAVKHYFERILKDRQSEEKGSENTKLRRDELLYDEAFNIVKTFLEASTKHTVEELQEFSNMRTPSPPWVLVVRLLVPMSCCDDAATYLTQALGGEEMTKKVVGGTKWWQVRGISGVDAEWIAAKKDWRQAEKRYRAWEEKASAADSSRDESSTEQAKPGVPADASAHYQPEMDEMRCILYVHGGGYYFGSVDQERYSIQRYARKINGRVFAINYRLAPQYPFPYLYLIRPPEGASHRPVKPSHIVVAGDSAGGGLCIALLQVLRDTGLPMPAGGVLISPWCDLTHSFPSIHINTATDVIPPYGLSLYKPSTLWPPPPDEVTTTVRESVRSRIRQAIGLHSPKLDTKPSHSPIRSPASATSHEHDLRLPQTGQTLHLGSTASLPKVDSDTGPQTITCNTKAGEVLSVDDQIHLYAPNYLLTHPLVSSVTSYLGGLPPLHVIASDKEVLRDEIIYFAHKAANPQKYPVTDEVRKIYPALQGIEEKYGPTQVHLQVYDDAAHVLPVLFSFTTPAKYCYRAIASFIKYVTGMAPTGVTDISIGSIPMTESPAAVDTSADESIPVVHLSPAEEEPGSSLPARGSVPRTHSTPHLRGSSPGGPSRAKSLFGSRRSVDSSEERGNRRSKSIRRAFSTSVSRASMILAPGPNGSYFSSRSVAEHRRGRIRRMLRVLGSMHDRGESLGQREDVRTAGEPGVYANGLDTMIRERVSTRGAIRPLEPEAELSAFALPPELIGVVSELAMRRYIDGKAKFDRKFRKSVKTIEKRRKRNFDFETAKKDAMKNMSQLQTYLDDQKRARGPSQKVKGVREGLEASGSWSWAWALDVDERPPPSSIVSRRDTVEAVRLARIADQSVLVTENTMTGNNLWSMIVNFLTVTPEQKHSHHHHHHHPTEEEQDKQESNGTKRERFRSLFAAESKKVRTWNRKKEST